MADRRIYAGYYRRYDGKMIYVVTMAKDADSDEDVVIWTPTVFSEKRTYYTMSKRSFCENVSVDGVHKAKFKRQTQMRMPPSIAEVFEEDRMVLSVHSEEQILALRNMTIGKSLTPTPTMNTPRSSVRGIGSAKQNMLSVSRRNGTSGYPKGISKSSRTTCSF